MKYKWRISKLSSKKENGNAIVVAEDYSNNCCAPIYYEDRLDETLDTGEIILENMPITTKKAFPPKTKIRIERLDGTTNEVLETYDMVVDHDDVEEYVGVPTYCTHRIHLIEPSVIAQGMHVDNIALTYELNDVDLNYKTTKDDESHAVGSIPVVQPPIIASVEEEFSYNGWFFNSINL